MQAYDNYQILDYHKSLWPSVNPKNVIKYTIKNLSQILERELKTTHEKVSSHEPRDKTIESLINLPEGIALEFSNNTPD